MSSLLESSLGAQTQTPAQGLGTQHARTHAARTHAHGPSRTNTHARGTYLHTPARGHDQVCVVTYIHLDALVQVWTRAHAGNQSAALSGPHPLCVWRPHFCTLRAVRHFELQGKQLALAWDSVAGKRGHHRPALPSPPLGRRSRQVTAAGFCAGVSLLLPFSANPQPRGHGEMTTTSAAFAVRRLHLDWPRHLWREGGGRGQGRQGGLCGRRLPLPQALPRNSAHVPSLSTLPAAAANAPLEPNNTRSHLRGFAHAAWKTLT